LNKQSEPILIETIDFDTKSEDGIAFVRAFEKSSVLENRHIDYLNGKLRTIHKEKEVHSLIQQLTSYEIRQKISGFLRNEFPDTDDETFLEALLQIDINISQKPESDHSKLDREQREGRRKRANGPTEKTLQRSDNLGQEAVPHVEIGALIDAINTNLSDALAGKIGIVTWIRNMISAGKSNAEIAPGYKKLLMERTGYDERKAQSKINGNLTYYRNHFLGDTGKGRSRQRNS